MPDLELVQAGLLATGLVLVGGGLLGFVMLFARFPARRQSLRIREWNAPGTPVAALVAEASSPATQWSAAYTGAIEEMFSDLLSLREELAALTEEVSDLKQRLEEAEKAPEAEAVYEPEEDEPTPLRPAA